MIQPRPVTLVAATLAALVALFVALGVVQRDATPTGVPSSSVTDTHTTWVTGESGSPRAPSR
ncbi:hypothetical protein ABZ208_35430 [Streptomyces sp. NPDC006208]|uniref:hypothetical protein n=1 Tax=Streptomyces sp. NPDC006208 TaxID=3156734 RepID=UPI0033B9F0C3